jgi:putative peptidoglycan lipid II flippase
MAFRATYLAVLAVTLIGQLAALGFEMAVAARFGTGPAADALAFGLVVLVALTGEVSGWVSTLAVPLYVEARAASPAAAAAFLRRMLAALIAITGGAALVLVAGAPALVNVLAPALGADGTALLRAFTPLIVLAPVATLFSATLQANDRFVGAAARQLAWYGGGLVAVVVMAPSLGAQAAPVGILAGMTLFTVGLGVGAMRPGRASGTRGPSLRRAAALLTPLLVLSAFSAANVAAERALAARLPEGGLAALTYAYRLLHFPLALFVVNAGAMLLPALSAHASGGRDDAAGALTGRAIRITLVCAVPLAALAMALAQPLTSVVLERGAFTASSTAMTATAIAWYAPGLIAMAIVQLLYRAYQARQALWQLAWRAGAATAISVVLMTIGSMWLGFRGLPLGLSLAGFMGAGLMLRGLPGGGRVLLPGSRTMAALAVAGVAAFTAAWLARSVFSDPAVLALVAGGAAGLAAYAAVLFAVAPSEARALFAVLVPAVPGRPA